LQPHTATAISSPTRRSAALVRALDRSVALPYAIVFIAVLAIFAAAVHVVVLILSDRESVSRLDTLARAGLAAADAGPTGIEVGEQGGRIVNPSEQGLEWFDRSGGRVGIRGLDPNPHLPVAIGPVQRYAANGESYAAETLPVRAENGRVIGYVRATQSDERSEASMRWVDLSLAAGFVLAALTSVAGGWYLSRQSVVRISENMRALEEFSANAAHELRTPLAAISANAEASLRAEFLSEQDRSRIETIVATADSMRRLSEDLLTLAATEGLAKHESHRVDVEEVVEDVARGIAPAARLRDVNLLCDVKGTPAVRGNPEQIERIVANLVENGVRYTEAGGQVDVACWTDRGNVVIVVSDTGIGIAPVDLQHIFERFWRAHRARRTGEGFGLGLAIVRTLVQRHGGTIAVRSRLGAGSEFRVTLPSEPATTPESGQTIS